MQLLECVIKKKTQSILFQGVIKLLTPIVRVVKFMTLISHFEVDQRLIVKLTRSLDSAMKMVTR